MRFNVTIVICSTQVVPIAKPYLTVCAKKSSAIETETDSTLVPRPSAVDSSIVDTNDGNRASDGVEGNRVSDGVEGNRVSDGVEGNRASDDVGGSPKCTCGVSIHVG